LPFKVGHLVFTFLGLIEVYSTEQTTRYNLSFSLYVDCLWWMPHNGLGHWDTRWWRWITSHHWVTWFWNWGK